MRFPIQAPRQSGVLIRVRMLTGKHAGLEVTILDIPYVVESAGPTTVRVLLPGLEGVGMRLTDKPQDN